MLTTVNAQRTLWESFLPESCLSLPAELEAVDQLLDDPVFFEPYRKFFDDRIGRPSIPIETYLRLMFLKFRYRLGFEMLCRETTDSISWQRFCRIPLGCTVPHPTTLMKITTRCGPQAIEGLNEALLAKASAAKVLKTNRVRADTTVVEANVAYPTDSGLLTKGVTKMARAVALIKAAGLAPRTRSRDRTRQAHKKVRSIAANLRRRSGEAKDEVKAINGELATIALAAVKEARNIARNARRSTKEVSTKVKRAIANLETTSDRVQIIADQSRQRLAGITPDGSKRLVSLHDIHARPIRKGRLGKPVEFGYKAQVVDNEDGVVVDYNVEIGNPADAPQLVPAVARISSRIGLPRAVTADRGYGEQIVADELHALGVRMVVLPTKGKPNATRRKLEQRDAFQKLVKWRTGCEGRISCLKRDFGWNRTRIDGIHGARTWCGYGVFNHNLVKIAGLMVAKP